MPSANEQLSLSEFLKLSLRAQARRHEKRCLCKECRAALFFDLLNENKALRNICEDAVRNLDRSIDHAVNTNQVVPTNISKAIRRLTSAIARIIHVELPDFTVRKEFFVLDIDRETIMSLLDVPIERPAPEVSKSKTTVFQRACIDPDSDLVDIGRSLEKKLGIKVQESPGPTEVEVGQSRINDLKAKMLKKEERPSRRPSPDDRTRDRARDALFEN